MEFGRLLLLHRIGREFGFLAIISGAFKIIPSSIMRIFTITERELISL